MTKIVRGEIWLASLNPTKGREQSGTRPVLVVSSNYFNQGPADLVFAIPLTSSSRSIRSHLPVSPPEGGLKVESFIMCEAMRSINKTRLKKRLGSVSGETMEVVEDLVRILLEL